jgi:hypothetical protein
MFLLGIYCGGVVVSFIAYLFLAILGGKNEDLWKPFVFAILWPLALPYLAFWSK